MKALFLALVGGLLLWSGAAFAQSPCPTIAYGAVLTAAQWNACFQAKQNTLGFMPFNAAGGALSGPLTAFNSTTTAAGLTLTPGTAPLVPNNGDMWVTSAGLYVRVNGSTVGPLGTAAIPTQIISSTGHTFTGQSGYAVCTAACTITPPVPAAGYKFCVYNDDNVSGVITLGAMGAGAMYENTARTAYGTAGTGTLVSNGAAANSVCITGRDSTHYLTTTFTGTWSAN